VPFRASTEALKSYRAARAKGGPRLKVTADTVKIDHPDPPESSRAIVSTTCLLLTVCCTARAAALSRGNRNALKHGKFTAEGLALKREISDLARLARETMRAIE
jgi:hypothetical protein